MNSILKQLYDGTLDPMTNAIPHGIEYYLLWSKAEEKAQYLAQQLPPEAVPQLDEFDAALRDAYNLDIYAAFSQGFRLGLELLWEVINNDT